MPETSRKAGEQNGYLIDGGRVNTQRAICQLRVRGYAIVDWRRLQIWALVQLDLINSYVMQSNRSAPPSLE